MASVDPSEIHPEYDRPEPGNIEEWSDEQLEKWNEANEAELDARVERNKVDMARDEREALDFLQSTTEADSELSTEQVNLGEALDGPDDVYVTVRTRVSGELESKFDRISAEQEKDLPRISNIKDEVIEAIRWLIVDDDEPDGDRYNFQSRAVWEAYYYDAGSEGLMEVFNAVADPALSRYEAMGNSRGRNQRNQRSR